MQKFIFISEDEAYSRDYVNPEEFKAAAKGTIKIIQLNIEYNTIELYDSFNDEFNEIRRTF
jgi:hypothetical protein